MLDHVSMSVNLTMPSMTCVQVMLEHKHWLKIVRNDSRVYL